MMMDDLIYLDNAATTFPKPEIVYREMDEYYRRLGGNAGRGGNPLARKATEIVEETRSLVMGWLQAPAVVFTPSATIALNMAIFGAGLRTGDVVYVTPFEHNSVLRPLEHLRQSKGIEVRLIPFDKHSFECDLDKMKLAFSAEPPSLLCITQLSNVFGNAPPVQDIISLAKEVNPAAIAIVDGAQAAGLMPLDLSIIDALVFSGHKSLYGPYGIAGIALGTDWLPSPLIYGGTGTLSEQLSMPSNGNSRYEAGSHNILAFIGLRAAIPWLAHQKDTRSVDHLAVLVDFIIEEMRKYPEVIVWPKNQKLKASGLISLSIDNVSPQSAELYLGSRNIAIRAGLHCAPWAHEFAGTLNKGGTLRISFGYFNSISDAVFLSEAFNILINQ